MWIIQLDHQKSFFVLLLNLIQESFSNSSNVAEAYYRVSSYIIAHYRQLRKLLLA
jgi:hypothetical protein